MGELTTHWTERDVDDFLYRIASDFVRQIETLIESRETTQAALAKKLNVSNGRISQVLNNPGNLTLRQIIKYARALGRKVSVVAYDDHDPNNRNGPINAEVFEACWQRAGRPSDFFALRESDAASATAHFVIKCDDQYRYLGTGPVKTSDEALSRSIGNVPTVANDSKQPTTASVDTRGDS